MLSDLAVRNFSARSRLRVAFVDKHHTLGEALDRPLYRIRRAFKLARQRLSGTVYLKREDLDRAYEIRALDSPLFTDETLPYSWTGEAFVRFWNGPLHLRISTSSDSMTEAQRQAMFQALTRNAPDIKPDSLHQIAEWFNATYANRDEYRDQEWYNAPMNTDADVLSKVAPPEIVLDFKTTATPGRFELHFPWLTHSFYDFEVSVNLWKVQPPE